MRTLVPLLASAALLLTLGQTAHAQNIVQDGDFENAAPGAGSNLRTFYNAPRNIGDGVWFVTQNTIGVDTNDFFVYAGAKSVLLTPNGLTNSLTQTLTTQLGLTYNISFYANANAANTFSVTFGGAAVLGAPATIAQNGFPNPGAGSNASRFTLYTGTAVATSTSTDLTFTATNTVGTMELDNVSVTAATPVPEVEVVQWSALLLGGGTGLLLHRKRQRAR